MSDRPPAPPQWGPPPAGPPALAPPGSTPPPWGVPGPAPRPPRTRRTGLVVAAAVAGVVVVGGVVAAGIAVGTNLGAGTTGGPGVAAGDCYVGPPTEQHVVDCAEPHDGEAFLVGRFDHDDHPGNAELLSEASPTCLDAFEGYVGQEFLRSKFNFETFVPTEEDWDDGDRRYVCALVDIGGERLTGAGRGSGE